MPRTYTITVPDDAADEIDRQAAEDKVPPERVIVEWLVCDCGSLRGCCYCENDD